MRVYSVLLFWRDCNSSFTLCLALLGKVHIRRAIVVKFIHIYANINMCISSVMDRIHKPKAITLLSSNVFCEL